MKENIEKNPNAVEAAANPSAIELAEMTKSRQAFKLNKLTSAISFQTNITYWEQAVCCGYNPQHKRLEAVVNVKQTSGYNGGLCSPASLEYVRFFVDFKDGAGFRDMGYTSFKVADISNAPPGPQHPLSYLAYMNIDDAKYKKFLNCDNAVIPTMRAVLSWNTIPSTNPNSMPYYGNRIDADIQLARKFKLPVFELAELIKFPDLVKYLDPKLELTLKTSQIASTDTFLKANRAAGVPDNRSLYSTIGSRLNSTLDFSKASSSLSITNIDKLGIDVNQFLEFFNGEGEEANTNYEELTCLGLNTASDSLGAVIHIKQNSGFSGNLCSNGSMEHVAFWADWNNNGVFDEYLGTVSLNVHDIRNIPAGGLYYNVLMPFDVSNRLKTCATPNVIRVRAVLSWESLPSTTNPNQLNTWGNYRDALVQLRPAIKQGGGVQAVLSHVGNVDRLMIHPTQFLYNYQAVSPSTSNNRPWGGVTNFRGIIDRNGFGGAIKYRIRFKSFGAPDADYETVAGSVTNYLWNPFAVPEFYPVTQAADADGWFIYQPNPTAHVHSNDANLLAYWSTGSLTDGTYTIRFEYTDEFGTPVQEDEFSVIICNKPMTISPTANVSVDTTKDLDLVIDGGDCHSYTPSDPIINGHLRAVHPYFASWRLELQPTSHTNGAIPTSPGAVPVPPVGTTVPIAKTYTGLGDTGPTGSGASGEWQLDTSALDVCGYTLSLGAYTRVILNSSGNLPYYAPKAVGFAKIPNPAP